MSWFSRKGTADVPSPGERAVHQRRRRRSSRHLFAGGALLGLATLAGLTAAGSPAQAAFPGANGKLACYGSINRAGSNPEAGTTFGIFTINPDGSQYTLLTNNGGGPPGEAPNDTSPSYSPDGKRIVFDSTRTGSGSELFTMNADGSQQRRLTFFPGDDGAPHFSPDGRQIVWTSSQVGNQFDVWRMNADGSSPTNLTPDNPTRNDGPPRGPPTAPGSPLRPRAGALVTLRRGRSTTRSPR